MLASEKQTANYRIKIEKDGLSSGKSVTRARQRGSILIVLIVTMVVMAVLGAGMVYLTSTSTFQELFANKNARAYYAAESGVRYANANIRQALATGKLSVFLTMENDVKNKTYTMAGDTFEITNWTWDASSGSMRVIYDSIGTTGSGFLQAKRKIRYTISPANQGNNPPAGTGDDTKGIIPRIASDFDISKQDLDVYYSPIDMSETDIKDNLKVDGDTALNLKSDAYTMGISWYNNSNLTQLDDVRNKNKGLLSYGVQVKIKDIDQDQTNYSPFSIAGISFRLDDRNNATTNDDIDNMYGISFVKLIKPGALKTSDPVWYKTYIHTNSAWDVFSVDNQGKWYVVLWKRIYSGTTPSYAPLAYRKLKGADSVCRQGTADDCSLTNYWSTIMVYVKEKSDGTNEITGYFAWQDTYPRSILDEITATQTQPIQWAEKNGAPDPLKVPSIFKPIIWTEITGSGAVKKVPSTVLSNGAVVDIIQDGSLTTINYNNYTIGDYTQTKAREIGLHIFNISTSAQNVYYDNFYIDVSPSYPPGGDFVDPDPFDEGF